MVRTMTSTLSVKITDRKYEHVFILVFRLVILRNAIESKLNPVKMAKRDLPIRYIFCQIISAWLPIKYNFVIKSIV